MIAFPDPPPGGYKVIVVDPPWDYSGAFMSKAPRWHDPTIRVAETPPYKFLSLEAIGGLPILDLAADDCWCFLWTTQRYLRQAFPILEGWGFSYKQLWTWDKGPVVGWIPSGPRQSTEFILLGRRGKPKWTTVADLTTQIRTPVYTCGGFRDTGHRHSQKPRAFYLMVERCTAGPRIDIFARLRHQGFDAWGDEVDDWCQGNLGLG